MGLVLQVGKNEECLTFVTTRHERVSCYNDFGSHLKINETFVSQIIYETHSFKNYPIQTPMKMCGFKNILF